MNPILYLTSEINNRDWDSRLMIADYAAANGFSSVVGQQWAVSQNVDVLPRGLVLFKTVNQIQANGMAYFKHFGHLVAAMDEESFSVAFDRQFMCTFAPSVASACDVFYANSPLHAAGVEQNIPGMAGKVVVTGNPRLDMLVPAGRARFAEEVAAIRQRYGRFILFNSNFVGRNTIWSQDELMQIQVKAGVVDPNNQESIDLFNKSMAFEQKNAEAFEALLRWTVEKLPSHAIVIRPHPVERHEYWTEFCGNNPRVHVALNTRHVPYMLAADIVVHANSTTGIEAAVLDRPTVNLVPEPDSPWSDFYVSKRVNPIFKEWQDAATAMKWYLKAGQGPLADTSVQKRELQRYYPGLGVDNVCKKMADHMCGMVRAQGRAPDRVIDKSMFTEGYKPMVRGEVFLKKFVKSFDEAVKDFNAVRAVTKLATPVKFSHVDESLFLVQPDI